MGSILCHLKPEFNIQKPTFFFSIVHFTQLLKRDCLHNRHYAISEINNVLAGGEDYKVLQIFKATDLASQAESVRSTCHPQSSWVPTSRDPIRDSALLGANKAAQQNTTCHHCSVSQEHKGS